MKQQKTSTVVDEECYSISDDFNAREALAVLKHFSGQSLESPLYAAKQQTLASDCSRNIQGLYDVQFAKSRLGI